MHLTDQSPDGMPAAESHVLLARRTQVDALSAKGREPHEIATELGIPLTVVTQDLQSIAMKRLARATRPGAEVLVDQLSSLDLVQKEAWLAWERSWKAQLRTTKGRKTLASGEQGHAAVTETDQLPDTKYLTLVLHCIDRRCELLAVKGPVPTDDKLELNITALARVADKESLEKITQGFLCIEQLISGEAGLESRP